MLKSSLLLFFLAACICIGLSACGQAGKLYLPPPTDVSSTPDHLNHET